MHAEKNSFAFFALGRCWSIPPGYHVVASNNHAGIMIQDPAGKDDPDTQGYVGESPADAPKGSSFPQCFPSPPGKLLEVTESPDKLYTLFSGDASAAYDYCYGPEADRVDTKLCRRDFMYPGLFDDLVKRCPAYEDELTSPIKLNPNYNPVEYAFRTVLFVRGARPYVLIVDDIKKDETYRNYRWTMNCCQAFGNPNGRMVDDKGNGNRSSLAIAPGATATEATLLHSPIDDAKTPGQTGLPRLLLRDVSQNDNANQPPIRIERALDHDPARNRVFIDRNNVIEPGYKLLFFPYRTGEPLPQTRWNADATQLTIDLNSGGLVDTIEFDASQPDHRTRLRFHRATNQ
jgi:hypothetical protein